VAGLDEVVIDVESRAAVVGPGTRGANLQEALNQRRLYFPGGTCSSVGIGGYTLGGGA